MMTMMKYMASARAGFLGQGAARIIRCNVYCSYLKGCGELTADGSNEMHF